MKTRVLTADEIHLLVAELPKLAEYHNRVAETFSGIYPIVPIPEALADTEKTVREGMARAEIVEDETGEIAGFCVVHFHGDTGDVDWLYVRDDARGEGWGKILLDNAMAYLKENGVQLVDLTVVSGNPAKDFYAEQGFVVRSELMTRRL